MNFFWVSVGGCKLFMSGRGLVWLDVGRSTKWYKRLFMDGCGLFMGRCGLVWILMGRCGSVWTFYGGVWTFYVSVWWVGVNFYGSMWVGVNFLWINVNILWVGVGLCDFFMGRCVSVWLGAQNDITAFATSCFSSSCQSSVKCLCLREFCSH